MSVLIACEYSGTIRDALLKVGIDAISCDLLDTDSPGPHYKGDVLDILYGEKWDGIIAHPDCTYLTNASVRWLYEDRPKQTAKERWIELGKATDFFNHFLNHSCKRKAIENPIPHKYAKLPKYTQTIQPYEFGHTTSKRTCLWLTGLPNLKPTKIIPKEERTQDIWLASPGPDRWKIRSKTFPGIAEAIADQWKNFFLS